MTIGNDSKGDRGWSLPERSRLLLAGGGGAATFLAAYVALGLVLWVALGAAVLVFGACLLIVRRTPAPQLPAERMLAPDVSAAELVAAVVALDAAAGELTQLEPRAPVGDRGLFAGMGGTLRRIASHHRKDPRDLRHTRRLLRHDLSRIVETAKAYVDLSARARGGADAERLAALSAQIHSYAPALERIERACFENDFMQLEVEAEVLSEQLARR